MQYFQMSEDDIKLGATDNATYQRGRMYFLNYRVHNLGYDKEEEMFVATVWGNDVYSVGIETNDFGKVQNAFCDCPAFHSYYGYCKHIVAVLKAIQQRYNNTIFLKDKNRLAVESIFSEFENTNDANIKEEINLEVTYILSDINSRTFSSVECKIGNEKLYIVKDIKDFIKKRRANQEIVFGKKFTYDPDLHTFNELDQKILGLFEYIYDSEDMLEDVNPYSYNNVSAFKKKTLYLSDYYMKNILELLKIKSFKAVIMDKEFENMEIVENDIPLNFKIQQKESDVVLALESFKTMFSLTRDGEYIFYDGKIYKPSKKQWKNLNPIFNAFRENQKREIVFSQNDKHRFASEILPRVEKTGKVIIDDSFKDSLYKVELQPKVYFDKHLNGISAKIEFNYGEYIINPFLAFEKSETRDDKILIKDIDKEKRILSYFEKYNFKVDKGIVYLHDENKIYEFIYDEMDQLKELAEIFYSESFKNIAIKNNYSFSGKVRLNETSDLLEFSFSLENVDNDELKDILESIKIKKKFYRLKDGSFIPLDNKEFYNISRIIDQMDISEGDLQKKVIELPKYRALFIDSLLRDSNDHHIERNLAFKQMVQNVLEPEDMEFDIPDELKSVLRDYQKIGFKWLKTLNAYKFGGILADDMGLGKTLQVIAFVLSEMEKHREPSIVIAPTSLIYNWQDEVKKFAPNMNITVISGAQKERHKQIQEIENADMVVTSYPLIRRDIDIYSEFKFAYCFLDEAQHIKNPATISAKSVKQIKAKGYFALTGTPIENSLTELWSIFDFILPGYLFSHNKFVKKFESPVIKNKDQEALVELSKHIKPFVLRRMKKDVLKELPEKIESKMSADMTDEQKKIYMAYLQKAKGEIAQEIFSSGFEKSQIKILAALTRLRQLCCHPALFIDNYNGESGKLILLKEIIEDAIDGGHRMLLFSQFTSMLQIIKSFLDKEKIENFYLDGNTKAEARSEMVKNFNGGNAKIFLISLKAGGTGLNLTGADMVIHYDPWWNPAVEDQATDRAYRIGQKNVVQVMKLITKGTIEEKIFELQQKKKEIISSVIEPGETFISKMTQEEIESLFEITD